MEGFEIPVFYKGKELMIPAYLQVWGYSYKIVAEIEGQTFQFEPDEERVFRAIHMGESKGKEPDKELIRLVAEAIETIVR
jgi:hypothetical protein